MPFQSCSPPQLQNLLSRVTNGRAEILLRNNCCTRQAHCRGLGVVKLTCRRPAEQNDPTRTVKCLENFLSARIGLLILYVLSQVHLGAAHLGAAHALRGVSSTAGAGASKRSPSACGCNAKEAAVGGLTEIQGTLCCLCSWGTIQAETNLGLKSGNLKNPFLKHVPRRSATGVDHSNNSQTPTSGPNCTHTRCCLLSHSSAKKPPRMRLSNPRIRIVPRACLSLTKRL